MEQFYKPTLQSTFGNKGNCLSACIATLFDVPINDVPWYDDEEEDWIFELSKWMRKKFGKYIVSVKFHSPDQAALLGGSLVISTIVSPSPDVERHAVITQNYNIMFDPMNGEENTPITDTHDATFLIIGDVRYRG